jgi:phosphoenolpyruvate carboxykinase (ATP)
MSIKDTRACIDGILNENILDAEFETLDVFNLQIPKELEGVNTEVLNPRQTWADTARYDAQLMQLAQMFVDNFKKYQTSDSAFDFSGAGPSL